MSIFMRGQGRYSYRDALDVTGVNLRRLQEICQTWPGERFFVHFDSRCYATEIRAAAEGCGLVWREETFREFFDPSDKHHSPARVQHDAQRVFDELGNLPASMDEGEVLRLANDAAAREKLIQSQLNASHRMITQLQGDLAQARDEAYRAIADLQAETRQFHAQLCDERSRQQETTAILQQQIADLQNAPFQRATQRIRRVWKQFRHWPPRERAA